jgi:predicted nucleic acid-binding protein
MNSRLACDLDTSEKVSRRFDAENAPFIAHELQSQAMGLFGHDKLSHHKLIKGAFQNGDAARSLFSKPDAQRIGIDALP